MYLFALIQIQLKKQEQIFNTTKIYGKQYKCQI